MKTINTLFIILFFAASLQATTITAVVNNGQWDSNATWNLNRLPQNNDTIYIPVGIIVVLDQHISLDNISVFINGTLRFDGGKLTFNSVSMILIQTGGKITGTSNNEQIRLGGIFKYKGEEGIISGPALANAVSGDGFLPLTLPVHFTSFTAIRSAAKNELNWVTSEEVNNSHFDVQRSEDGQNWKNIAVIFAVTNPGAVNRYAYTDHYNASNKVYYRLKQVDNDGKYFYSAIKTISGDVQTLSANIYTTSRKTIAIEFREQVKGKVTVRIVNLSGQSVSVQQVNFTTNRMEVAVPNVVPGVYAIQVWNGDNKPDVRKVIF